MKRLAGNLVAIGALALLFLPLVWGATSIRALAMCVASGLALALLNPSVRELRRLSMHGDYGEPRSIATVEQGEEVTLSGRVVSDASVKSPTGEGSFACLVVTLTRTVGDVGTTETILSQVHGSEIEIADATGRATVQLAPLDLFASVHRAREWTGNSRDPIPAEVRAALPIDTLERTDQPLGEDAPLPTFVYRELSVGAGDEIVVRGRVLSVERHLAPGDGYRSNDVDVRALVAAPEGGSLRIRALPQGRLHRARSRAVRGIVLGALLVAWAAAVFFVPSIWP